MSSIVGRRWADWWTTTAEDWRRFFDPRFRAFHRLALLQGLMVVVALDVVVPFAIEIGCPPALTALLGALPIAGGMAQLAVPRLLARTDGNLRGLTVLAAAIGEARGFLYGLVALGIVLGLLGGVPALVVLAAIIAVAGVASAVAGANLLAWYSAVLPEEDRRLVVPRMTVLVMAVSALVLFPLGIGLDLLVERFGLVVYALLFGMAGLVGIGEVAMVRRLPPPGRVLVPRRAMAGEAPETPAERQFLQVSLLNSLGMGLTPFWSVYAMSILGLSAGFALTMSAVSQVAMVVAAAVGGGLLMRGSSARMLRASIGIRIVAVVVPILAMPGTMLAPLLMYVSAALASIGFALGQLATNERLFRLVRGPTVIRQFGRLLFRNSAAMTTGQVASGVVLAIGAPLGYPAFAALFGASALVRIAAYRAAGDLPRSRESGESARPVAPVQVAPVQGAPAQVAPVQVAPVQVTSSGGPSVAAEAG
ncbi:hypothetical protein BH23CHL7_BH23CHL7_18130 [soil metagenome]